MTNPTFFTVVADYKSVVVDLESDVDADPQLGPITAKVTFTPVLAKGDVILATNASPRPTGYVGAPIVARIDTDGRLKLRVDPDGDRDNFANLAAFPATGNTAKVYFAIDTQTFYRWSGSAYVETLPYAEVRLLADTALLELDGDLFYKVTFSEVTFNGASGYISPFTFQAPTSDTVLNLIEVTPVPGQPASGITKIAPGAVRLEDGEIVFSFAGVDIPDAIPFEPSFTAAEITDSGVIGRDLVQAETAASARATIGATDTGSSLLTAASAAVARTAINTVGSRIVSGTGIDLTGATNSSTAFQAILTAAAADAAAASGIVEVYIPPGTLSLTTGVTVGAGVTLRGAGLGATKITSAYAPGSGLGILQLNGASDITIADLTVEATAGGSNSIGMSGGYNGLQSRVTITNCRVTGTTNNAVRFPYAVKDLTFSDNTLDDCDAGFVSYAPTVASGLISSGWIISNNRFRDVGSVNIGLYGGTNALTVSTVRGVEISGNDLRDFKQTAGDGPIPIEPTCVTNIVIANNTIDGTATNGISTGCNVNMTITGNIVRNQSNYAIELNGGKQITIVGNVVENCRTFANDTADPAITVPLSDILISDNVYVGSGLSSAATVEAITFNSARRVRITNNFFSNWEYLRSAVKFGNSSATYVVYDSVVEGNTFIATDANTKVLAVNVNTAVRCSVRHNTFRVNRATVVGDDFTSVINISQDANSSETLIDGNHIIFSGNMTATSQVSGISNGNAAAAACASLTICNNIVRNGNFGLRPVTNSTDLVVYGNDTFTCGADSIPATAKANGTRLASLLDTNGKTAIAFGATSNAVNHLKVTNAATGNQITAEAAGSDANINFMIAPKGTGIVTIHDGPGNWLARFRPVTSAVNYWQIFSSAAGTAISASAAGSDSNIGINLIPKGTGTVQANGNPVGVRVAVPATATSTGVVGQFAADSSWFYVVTATNTWVRAALATW